jgi:MarR family protein
LASGESQSTDWVDGMQQSSESSGQWTFLTNHAHVLLSIASDPALRLRDIAEIVGITERATQRIVSNLVDGGYLVRHRVGRRSHYEVRADLPLRHPVERHHSLGELVDTLTAVDAAEPASRSRTRATPEPQLPDGR